MIKWLTPHLRGLSLHPRQGYGFNLRHFLPAAAQLEQITGIEDKFLSCLGHLHMLKVLHIDVRQRHQHSTLLTAPLPRLHTLSLRFHGTLFRQVSWQGLFSHAPALRQLVLDCSAYPGWPNGSHDGLDTWDIEAMVGVQCQQLDLLTLETDAIDEHIVHLLARIQCPLKLSINICNWRRLRSAPLNTLLAHLPNLVALTLILLSYVLWDQHGSCLPDVQRLEIVSLPPQTNSSNLPII